MTKLMSFKYAVPVENLIEIQAKVEEFMRSGGVEFTNLGAWPYDPEAPKAKFITRKSKSDGETKPQQSSLPFPQMGATDARVYEMFMTTKRPMSTREIENLTKMSQGQVSSAVHRLVGAGRITRIMRGVYQLV